MTMTLPTWFLILYLSTGGIGKVIEVESPIACVVVSHFEMRFDPDVAYTYCGMTTKKFEI